MRLVLKIGSPLALALFPLALAPMAWSQATPYSGATEQGVPFPLPQATDAHGRRIAEGESNSLTVSWDGRLILYRDRGDALWAGRPAGATNQGYVFATFDPSAITVDGSGRPDFSACIGAPYPRFADVGNGVAPNGTQNDYPAYTGYTGGTYPYIGQAANGIGTMGELGLHHTSNLSDDMYPVPVDRLPSGASGENPFPSDASGSPDVAGGYRTYLAYVTFQDLVRFWNGSQWEGYQGQQLTEYQQGTYPNGITTADQIIKRNGICALRIVVDPAAHTVQTVDVLTKWKPFRIVGDGTWGMQSGLKVGLSVPSDTEMWADNFEPILTLDGHLMVGKGSPLLCQHAPFGPSRVVFYYNQDPFAETGWEGPWEFHWLYLKRDVLLDGRTIAERYPISRHPIKDYDGTVLGDGNDGSTPDGDLSVAEAQDPQTAFEGGYTWISPDGRYLLFSVYSAGVGSGHPETDLAQDGGGSSNRGQVSLVGSVTGWQMWRLDNAAENPSRHMFTGWDQDSRTTHQRVASFGFSPGFWDLLRGSAGLPLRNDGRRKLQLVNSQRLLYYEVELAPYEERDYGFYLPMSEMLDLLPNVVREVDLTRTPDLSGNGHFGTVQGAELPCEYFELPASIYDVPGLYTAVTGNPPDPEDIHPGWTSADVVAGGHGGIWALIADGEDGKDLDADGIFETQPFAGRGELHDMDSDVCWGRVGQAMFFRQATKVLVSNAGTPPELNPGTDVPGASDELTASLWVHPLQARNTVAQLLMHSVEISLEPDGTIDGVALDPGGYPHPISSPAGAAPLLTWTHVALTWKDTEATNESELRLYVNGVEVAGSPLVLPFDRLMTSTDDIRIGCLSRCATVPADAVLLLDEVALKNSALVGQDVADLALLPIVPPTWDNGGDLPTAPLPFDNDTDARVPVGHAYDAGVAELGADLFRDVQLSANKEIACATCHQPESAFVTPGQAIAVGLGGPLLRNTPTIYGRRFATRQFWEARAVDLEDQALDPVFEPLEMGLDWPTLDAYLENDPDYDARFASVLGASDITEDDVRFALATYMRAPTTGLSLADQFEAGATGALTASELHGRALFHGKARCSGCHNGPNLTDERLWTTGTFRSDGTDDGASAPGAGPSTVGRARYRGSFKTPTLRELARTAPYFHDGHAATLADVVDFYDAGGVRQDGLGFALDDPDHDFVAEEINRRLGLTPAEKTDLVAYLETFAGTEVDDGPVGLDLAPTVTIVSVVNEITGVVVGGGGGGTTKTTVTLNVKDLDGPSDLDPSMDWTLEIDVSGTLYHWSDATLTPITRGWHVVLVVSPSPSPVTVQARAADHHGRWGDWVAY